MKQLLALLPFAVIFSCVFISCKKDKIETTTDTETLDEVTVEGEFDVSRIFGAYSGSWIKEESWYSDFMDDGEPAEHGESSDSGLANITVDRVGGDSIIFLPIHLFPGSNFEDPLNVAKFDLLDPSFDKFLSGGGYLFRVSGRFAGENLDSLYIETKNSYEASDNASSSYETEMVNYFLKKD